MDATPFIRKKTNEVELRWLRKVNQQILDINTAVDARVDAKRTRGACVYRLRYLRGPR